MLDFILLKFDNIVFSKRLKYQIIHYLYFTNIIKLQLLKNANWQTSGLLGYHATIKMQNTATTSKELYAVGSEVSISS